MRIVGICASVFAAHVLMLSTPAFAAPSDAQAATTAPADKKPAKAGRKKATKKADAVSDGSSPMPAPAAAPTTKKRGKKPTNADAVAATPDAPLTPAPAPVAAPTPVPESATRTSTTSLTSADVPADTKPAADAKAEPKQEDGTVEVHIDSPSAVTLEKRSAESTWAKACDAPCDAKLGVSDEYRLVGTDLNESRPFHIDASKGKVTLNVTPGTSGGRTRGVVTTIGSGAVLAGGVVVILVGMKHHGDADGELSQPRNDAALLAGGAMVFAGIVGGIVGTSWIVNNAHTSVDGDVRKAGSANAARLPVFNTPKQVGMPALTTVPLLSGSF